MDAETRNEKIKKMFQDDLDLLLKKGYDYSGDSDCMRNLRDFGFLGVVVRLGDKYHRLKSFIENKKMKVKDESVIDTLRDMRNYAFLAQILWEDSEEISELEAAICFKCGKKINGTTIHGKTLDNGWWLHEECYNQLQEEKK